MPMNKYIVALALAGAAALATARDGRAAALDPQQVPKDAKWLLHLDADQTKASMVGSAVIGELVSRPESQQGLDMLLRLAGFSMPKDLHGVTLYGTAFGEEHNVVLIHGTFDVNRILGVLELAPAYTNESYASKEIVSWEDKGKTSYGAFLRDDLIVIARSADRVKKAVDVFGKKHEAMPKLSDAAPLKDAGVLVYATGSGLAELANAQQASPAMRNAESAWLAIGETANKQLFARGHVESPNAQQAQRLLRSAEGIRAIISMQAADENADERLQFIDGLLAKLQMKQTEKGVDLSLETPAQEVVDAIKDQVLRPGPVKN